MTFSELHEGITCNCVKDAVIDNCSVFTRRVNLNPKLKNGDFKYSKNKRPENDDCTEWCGIRGISIHIYNNESIEEIIEKNMIYMGIATGSKKQLSVFKIKSDGGMVKNTPNQKDGIDKYHFDFYKPDDFDTEKHLELVELITVEDLEKMKNV
jgi:hypothetical protein